MRKSIASLVLATIAVLMVTASVAAADPFGWRHTATANGATTYRDGQNTCCSADRTYAMPAATFSTVPTAAARPTAAPVPAATRVGAQTHPTPTVRPAVKQTTTRHTSHDPSRHHADWCDHDGHDDHGMHR